MFAYGVCSDRIGQAKDNAGHALCLADGAPEFKANAAGVAKTTAGFFTSAGTLKMFSTVASWVEVAENGSPNSFISASATRDSFNQAASVCSGLDAGLSIFKTVEAIQSPSASVKTITPEVANLVSKASEFSLAMSKAGVVDAFSETTSFALKTLKNGGSVIKDGFSIAKSIENVQKFDASKAPAGIKQATVDSKEREVWANLIKNICAFAFHAFSLVATLFALVVSPLVGLSLGTAYCVSLVVHTYIDSFFKDELANDHVGRLNSRIVTGELGNNPSTTAA